jgi:hypothetical protein
MTLDREPARVVAAGSQGQVNKQQLCTVTSYIVVMAYLLTPYIPPVPVHTGTSTGMSIAKSILLVVRNLIKIRAKFKMSMSLHGSFEKNFNQDLICKLIEDQDPSKMPTFYSQTSSQ